MIQRQSKKSINQTSPKGEAFLNVFSLPILDMQSEDFGEQLVANFQGIGFGIVTKPWDLSSLNIPRFQKGKIGVSNEYLNETKPRDRTGSQRNRGYTGPGQEAEEEKNKYNQKKQTFDLGHPDGPDQLCYYPKIQSFIQISKKIYEKLFAAYLKIIQALQKGLKLEKNLTANKCYQQTLRYLYYPEVTIQQLEKTGKIRTNAHSDYGTVTLLFQKPGFGQNGLRALNPEDHWVNVHPPDCCMVINLGDLFHHWTNDTLESTILKVEVDDQIIEKYRVGSSQQSQKGRKSFYFVIRMKIKFLNQESDLQISNLLKNPPYC